MNQILFLSKKILLHPKIWQKNIILYIVIILFPKRNLFPIKKDLIFEIFLPTFFDKNSNNLFFSKIYKLFKFLPFIFKRIYIIILLELFYF